MSMCGTLHERVVACSYKSKASEVAENRKVGLESAPLCSTLEKMNNSRGKRNVQMTASKKQ